MPGSTVIHLDQERYGRVAMILHWVIAFAILGLIVMGLVMTRQRPGTALQFQLFQLHKSVGITVLALSILRLGWRLAHRPPPLPATMPKTAKLAAEGVHWCLYALMLGLPLSGWAVVSASPFNIPTVLFGVLPWPHLPILATLPDKGAAAKLLEAVHTAGAWVLVALLVLHVGAALGHHWWLRDDTLRRMLPRRANSTRRDDHG